MAGCRNLTDNEIELVIDSLKSDRDRALFVLGYTTGFRISELLSIKIKDVYDFDNAKFKEYVKVNKQNVKGKTESKENYLHPKALKFLQILLDRTLSPQFKNFPIFMSKGQNVKIIKPISRIAAHNILKKAYSYAGLTGSVATHSMRKSFAMRVYKNSGHDLALLQQALNHSSITTTINYLPKDSEAIKNAIKKI